MDLDYKNLRTEGKVRPRLTLKPSVFSLGPLMSYKNVCNETCSDIFNQCLKCTQNRRKTIK